MNHENTTKCAQNVHREPWHKQTPLTDGCNNSQNGPAFSIRLTVSVSVLHDVIKKSQVRVLHRLRWKCNRSCVSSTLRNKSFKFNKISPAVLNKIMLKNYLALFLGTQWIVVVKRNTTPHRKFWCTGHKSWRKTRERMAKGNSEENIPEGETHLTKPTYSWTTSPTPWFNTVLQNFVWSHQYRLCRFIRS